VRLGILVGVKDINIERVGGTAQTGRDWSSDFANLAHVGGHRWRHTVYTSGSLTVGPATYVDTLSVSGIGYQIGLLYHYSSGVPPYQPHQRFNVDGQGYLPADWHGTLDVSVANGTGLASVGWHLNRIYVSTWDTAAHKYAVYNQFLPPRVCFRTSLAARLINDDATYSSTQMGVVGYNLVGSSKRILCKLPKVIDARALRARAGSKRLIHPLVVESLGYFEKEEEHPYRDHLADIPNEWDDELTLPDGTKVRSASPKKAKTVLTLIVPEDWTTEKALGKIKPEKVLSEE